jgi:small subunit ribosomal protein S27e
VLACDIDLLAPPAELEKRKHKQKRLVASPNSYFMDVKCQGCFTMCAGGGAVEGAAGGTQTGGRRRRAASGGGSGGARGRVASFYGAGAVCACSSGHLQSAGSTASAANAFANARREPARAARSAPCPLLTAAAAALPTPPMQHYRVQPQPDRGGVPQLQHRAVRAHRRQGPPH